jgi:large subunit ribosomal protein L3
MTQLFDAAGKAIPVTVIQAGPCHVLQLRTAERDGYEAVQVGFADKPRRLASRAARGHVARLDSKRQKRRAAAGAAAPPKADCEPQKFIREFRTATADYQVGQQLNVDIFRPALAELPGLIKEAAAKLAIEKKIDVAKEDWEVELKNKAAADYQQLVQRLASSVRAVDITGTSKGRGFQGVIKRHHYSGQRASHGVKKVHRHPGSTGCNTSPARVVKGRRMAGHLGHDRITVRNLKVVQIDPVNNLILVRGAVPGPNQGWLIIRQSNKL